MTCDSVEITTRNHRDRPTVPGDLILTPANPPPAQTTDRCTSSTFGGRWFWPLVRENDFYALLLPCPPAARLPFTAVQRINCLIPSSIWPIECAPLPCALAHPTCWLEKSSQLLILSAPDGCRDEITLSPVHAALTCRLIHTHLLL